MKVRPKCGGTVSTVRQQGGDSFVSRDGAVESFATVWSKRGDSQVVSERG